MRIAFMTDDNSFDYVVVGGGTAGCIVAKRIAEETNSSVVLLEAGPSDAGIDQILDLRRWSELLGGAYDYDFTIEHQPRGNSDIRHSRGRMLGGCSSHNSCIAFVPPASDFEPWGPGWELSTLLPYFDRIFERVNLEKGRTDNEFSRDFIDASVAAGYDEIDFGKPFAEGVGWLYLNKRDTQRESSSVAYLHSSGSDEPHPTVVSNASAHRLVLTELVRSRSRLRKEHFTPVKKSFFRVELSVRLTCLCFPGSVPLLISRSSTFPASSIWKVLGKTSSIIQRVLSHGGSRCLCLKKTIQKYEVAVFDRIDPDAVWPDIMFHMGLEPFGMCTEPKGFNTPEHGFSMTPNITRARSRGNIQLRSSDPAVHPRIDFRYYTDPEGYDERIMVEGIRRARAIVEHSPLKPWIDFEAAPGPDITSFSEVSEFVRGTGNTVYHPAGSCAMGSETDPHTVVDSNLRVRGIDSLRIADASVFPNHVSVNPNMTVMMIAERCADLVTNRTQ